MIIAKKKKKIIKHFNKDLVKFTEDGRSFKSNKKCQEIIKQEIMIM